jgi:methyl-accepting chemotaxis protein
MALFDLFRRLSFFKGRNTEGITEQDLDFKAWIQAHRDWRQRLTNHINGAGNETLDEDAVCRDDRCALGRWIYENGVKYYGDLELFRNMRYHHAEFHRTAGKVVRCLKEEGVAPATKMLHNDFDRHSVLVISDLQNLEKTVNA